MSVLAGDIKHKWLQDPIEIELGTLLCMLG